MSFWEPLSPIVAVLQREGRVSRRTLKLRYQYRAANVPAVWLCAARAADGPATAIARRFGTLARAMTLAEAIETARLPRVVGLTGDRTACVSIHSCQAPHRTNADVDLLGKGQLRLR